MASEDIPKEMLPLLEEIILQDQKRMRIQRQLSKAKEQLEPVGGLFWEQWETYHPDTIDEEDHRICYKEKKVYWKETADFYL